jgi:hypothetical protein
MGRGLIQDRRPKLPLVQNPKRSALHQALASVSTGYSCVLGRLPTCYSPVRRSSTPEGAFPLDLHVLSTPPAFVLSQDQTLQEQVAKTASPTTRVVTRSGIVGRSLTMKESLRPVVLADRSALKGRRTHRLRPEGRWRRVADMVSAPRGIPGVADEPDVDQSGMRRTPKRSPNC